MSKLLKATFTIQAVLDFVVGGLLLVFPGGSLSYIGWGPVEPIIIRIFGAALIAMGWTCVRGFLAKERGQVTVLIEMQAIFCSLGALGILRHLIKAYYPLMVWIPFGVLVVMAGLWAWALLKNR